MLGALCTERVSKAIVSIWPALVYLDAGVNNWRIQTIYETGQDFKRGSHFVLDSTREILTNSTQPLVGVSALHLNFYAIQEILPI